MSNIALSVDDELIRKVRKIAIDKNTTLTQMVRDFLASVVARDAAQRMRTVRQLERSFEKFSRDMGKRNWSHKLVSEDLNDGQEYNGIVVENPSR
jgi:alkylation response protein AidB-like acyl-CoA dehydrogenase